MADKRIVKVDMEAENDVEPKKRSDMNKYPIPTLDRGNGK